MEQRHAQFRRRGDDDGGGGGGGGRGGQSRCALCVLSCLLLMLGVMLARLFTPPPQHPPTLHVPDKDPRPTAQDDDPQHRLKTNGEHVLYNPGDVRVQRLDSQSSSLTGRPCGEDRCSTQYDDFISDVLVTADGRVVVSTYYMKALRVESHSGVGTVHLHCHPKALAEIPNGLIAVTCYFEPVIVFVNISTTTTDAAAAAAAAADDDDDPLQQKIQTEKLYRLIAVNPKDNTLLVSFRSLDTTPRNSDFSVTETNSIDVLTMEGKFVRTLFSHATLKAVTSLCVCHEYLIVTDSSGRILRIPLSSTTTTTTTTLKGDPKGKGHDPVLEIFANTPNDKPLLKAVSDTADAIFVVKPETVEVVWKKTRIGTGTTRHHRQLMEVNKGHVFETIAVFQDRLLVVVRVSGQRRSRVNQYRLA